MNRSSEAGAPQALSFLSLLKRSVYDSQERLVGHIEDALIAPRQNDYPTVEYVIIVNNAKQRVRMRVTSFESFDGPKLKSIGIADDILQPSQPYLHVRKAVLGCRILDLRRQSLVKAYDVRLQKTQEGWLLTGLDVHKHGWFNLGFHQHHTVRDWKEFVLLAPLSQVSDKSSLTNHLHRIKAARLADIIEEASPHEQHLLLSQLHTAPELEAHVFEEIGDEGQLRLFKSLSDQEVADILARMRADDAADAVMDLPQFRRETVLRLLPEAQSRKIYTLLGYHEATAGGLMGTEYLALAETQTIGDALEQIRDSTTLQPEALTSIFSLRLDGTLGGVLGIIRALQLDPATRLIDAVDSDIIYALPEDDVATITTRMSDFNLLNLPVLDRRGVLIGIVTVDDALEAAIPRDWFQRREGLSMRSRSANLA